MIQLREYQQECLDRINEMKIGERKIAFLATGAGKTIIMSKAASQENGRVLIVVDQNELREQTIDKLSIFINKEDIGSVQGVLDEVDKRVIVATRQSLTHGKSTRLNRMLENGEFNLLLIDETHRAVQQVKKIIEECGQNAKVIGFTATPFNPELLEVYSDFVYRKEIVSLVKEGYLCSPRCLTIYSDVSLDNVKTVAGEFNLGQLDEVVNVDSRNELIVKKYVELAEGRSKTLCFCTSIEHAEALANEFNKNNIKAKNIDSTLSADERKETLEAFKRGEIEVLTNIGVLTTGFDEPSVDCIIMARPTKSKILFTQMAGRGLRISENKEDCLILDVCDVTTKKRMNLMTGRTIFDLDEDETIQEKEERIQRDKEESERREKERIQREIEIEKMRQKEIDLFNETVENISQISTLHWFYTDIKGVEVAILSQDSKIDHYIVNLENEFRWYKRTQLEGWEHKLELIDENTDLKELVTQLEFNVMLEGSSFISKKANWKWEEPTEKQKQACKTNAKTKWGVHCFFNKRNCYFSLKDVI
ncbi:DEAD/DEAH box helicase [Clostridium saudiense]|uniref:DEAD/DEAH box helicase n=1 Tax=Clostridium saudiense TaxID=1414720 RepID=UPI00319E9D16